MEKKSERQGAFRKWDWNRKNKKEEGIRCKYTRRHSQASTRLSKKKNRTTSLSNKNGLWGFHILRKAENKEK